jgi:phosphatidylserine/phosphatidylglycerophosphate/cardiolipin synthase-like enzyme
MKKLASNPEIRSKMDLAEKAFKQSQNAFGELFKAKLTGDETAKAKATKLFETGRDELRRLFVESGGMQPGRGEAVLATVLDKPLKDMKKKGMLPEGMDVDKVKEVYVGQMLNNLRASVWTRENPLFEGWDKMAANLTKEVKAAGITGKGVDSPEFRNALATQCNTKVVDGNELEYLTSGKELFNNAMDLVKNAKAGQPCYVEYWAIEDDESGKAFAKALVEAKKRGVDVRVAVDGKIAENLGAKESLPMLEKAGIEVVKWHDKDESRGPTGSHRKGVYTPDGAVTGGSNMGDDYTWGLDGIKGDDGWSDLNAKVVGPYVKELMQSYETMLKDQGQSLPAINSSNCKIAKPKAGAKTGATALIEHEPMNAEQSHNILKANMKMLEAAKPGQDVNFANAYFIMTPPMQQAIESALARGVNVNVFTNSPDSVDEPSIGGKMLDSAIDMLQMDKKASQQRGSGRLNVYMPKPGDKHTNHDKWGYVTDPATPDKPAEGVFSMFGSYNMHARSETLEREMMHAQFDKEDNAKINERWQEHLAGSVKLSMEHDYVQQRLAKLGPADVLAHMFGDTIF